MIGFASTVVLRVSPSSVTLSLLTLDINPGPRDGEPIKIFWTISYDVQKGNIIYCVNTLALSYNSAETNKSHCVDIKGDNFISLVILYKGINNVMLFGLIIRLVRLKMSCFFVRLINFINVWSRYTLWVD